MDVPAFSSPVDDYAPFEPVTKCEPSPKPGVVAFRSWVLSELGGTNLGISRACPGGKATSKHHEGRAWDWGPPSQSAANELLDCLLKTRDGQQHALARRAGLRVIIYNRQIWTPRTRDWQPYTKPNPHTDHIHFAFSWDGARAKTSLYTLTPTGDAVVAAASDEPVQVASVASLPGRMIPPRRTPLTEQALAEVLAAGHIRAFGLAPSYDRLGMAWALVNHETARTKSAYNFNWGNIACTGSWPGQCHTLESIKRDFRAYPGPLEGAEDFWRLLQRRYSAALAAFDDGDADLAAAELRAKGYYDQDEHLYAAALSRLFDEYEQKFRDHDWRRRLAPLVAAVAVAAAAAFVAKE